MDNFTLIKFLKENLEYKNFKIGYDNCYIYCNFNSSLNKLTYHWSIETKDLIIGVPYFTFKNLDYVIENLTSKKIDPRDLQTAFKKLDWI